MEIKTAEITDAALDWAVAKCEGRTIKRDPMGLHDRSYWYWIWEEVPSGRGGILIRESVYLKIGREYSPSTNWAQGGPIIEREGISLRGRKGMWYAMAEADCGGNMRMDWCRTTYRGGKRYGPSTYEVHARVQRFDDKNPLIAAMRCYVASKLGDEVEIPEELL